MSSPSSATELRLQRLLTHTRGFRLIIVQYNQPSYRDQIIQQQPHAIRYQPSAELSFQQFEQQLAELSQFNDIIHIYDLESHLTATFFQGLNYHRELIAERCPAILIFWLSESGVRQLATQAADFWAWRSGVFDFSVPLQPRPAAIAERIDEDRASRAERLARIEAIGEYLADYTESDSRRADLLQECGILQESLGEWALAMADLEAARTLYQALADQLNATITLGYIARIKTNQGEIEAALNLYQHSLQLFEKLGARREYAIISEEINQLLTQEESGYPRKQSIFKRFWRWLKHK